jgi:hypothetical protein
VHCYCVPELDIDACGVVPLSFYCGDEYHGIECAKGVPDPGSPCSTEGSRCGDPCRGWNPNPYARACSGGVWIDASDPSWTDERYCGDL